jgi:hypothetical protein
MSWASTRGGEAGGAGGEEGGDGYGERRGMHFFFCFEYDPYIYSL